PSAGAAPATSQGQPPAIPGGGAPGEGPGQRSRRRRRRRGRRGGGPAAAVMGAPGVPSPGPTLDSCSSAPIATAATNDCITCATDYVTWRNELEPGVEQVNNVSVRRFRVKHERDPLLFAKRSDRVFLQRHSLGDELDWLDAEGPTSPALIEYITKHAADYDY